MTLPAKQISPHEIRLRITNLQNNKSPGYDLINNDILKKLSNKTILFLTHIFNVMFRLSYIGTTNMEIFNYHINHINF